MRVALICEYFYPDNSGGTPTDLSDLCRFLQSNYAGLEIQVVTSRNIYRPNGKPPELATDEDWHGIKIHRIGSPKSNRPSMVMRLIAGGIFSVLALFYLIRQRRQDALMIVTNPPANGMAAWLYSKLRRVPYVYLIHDLYPDTAVAMGRLAPASPIAKAFSHVQRMWLNGAACIVSLGRCMAEHLQQCYGVPPAKIEVITSWADPRAIFPVDKQNTFRKKHNLSGFVAVYAGNFSHYVNFDQILAAARLLQQTEGITFLLIGGGVRRQEIIDRIARENLRNVVVLPPVPKAEMSEVLGAADVSLVPLASSMAGLGVPSKLYSILASGRPVLGMVPVTSEVARVIQEEDCGINVLDADPQQLAAALKSLSDDREFASRMGRNGRRALEARFTIAQTSARYFDVFRKVTQTNSAAREHPAAAQVRS